MISYGFLKMLPANPHGSCGFTVEVGSMAPLVKVGEGLKVGVATQLLPGLGCFCTSLWTSGAHKFEKQRTFFLPSLDHGHQDYDMRNMDQQQCPKRLYVNIHDYFLPECSQ